MDALFVRHQLLRVKRLLQRIGRELAHVHLERPGDPPGRCYKPSSAVRIGDCNPADVRAATALPGRDVGHVHIFGSALVAAHPGGGLAVGVALVGPPAIPFDRLEVERESVDVADVI